MSSLPNPQAGSATALAQLLSEFPDLPPLRWGVNPDGHLSGYADVADVDAAMDPFFAVLGAGHTQRFEHTDDVGDQWVSFYFFPVWRDVQFHITLHGMAQTAPTALPSAWSAKAVAA